MPVQETEVKGKQKKKKKLALEEERKRKVVRHRSLQAIPDHWNCRSKDGPDGDAMLRFRELGQGCACGVLGGEGAVVHWLSTA